MNSNAVPKTAAQILTQDSAARNQDTGCEAGTDDEGAKTTKRRIEIIVEQQRSLSISTRRISAVGWCAPCGQKVQMVTAEDAAQIAQVNARTIYRRTESGQLHFIESQEGILLICTRSLRDG